jgi:hypothetical protein
MFDTWLQEWMATHRKPDGKKWEAVDIAKALDLREGTVSRWLNGKRKPSRTQVARLSVFCQVSPMTILRITDPEEFAGTVQEALHQHNEAEIADDISEVLAQVPELRKYLGNLARMTPEKRAAIMMLARAMPGEEPE